MELVLATPVVLWGGWPFFVRAVQALRHGTANMFTLIALGTGAAWAFSVVATIGLELFPAGFRAGHGAVPVYFEAAAVIVTLVKGDLQGIAKARALSRAVMANIRQNLFFAFAYNLLGVPIAAGVLYPFFGLLLSPMMAAAAMSLSSVSVVANVLRLRTLEI